MAVLKLTDRLILPIHTHPFGAGTIGLFRYHLRKFMLFHLGKKSHSLALLQIDARLYGQLSIFFKIVFFIVVKNIPFFHSEISSPTLQLGCLLP